MIYLLDPTPLQEHGYVEQLELLERELADYSADLANRPRVVALAKVDAVADVDACLAWAEERGIELHAISSFTGQGLDRLMHRVADEIARHVRESPARAGYLLHRPLDEGFVVRREGSGWVVEGRAAERAVNLNDLTLPEAADLAARRLTRIGVDAALANAGARRGDDVRIGSVTFTYEPDESADAEVVQ